MRKLSGAYWYLTAASSPSSETGLPWVLARDALTVRYSYFEHFLYLTLSKLFYWTGRERSLPGVAQARLLD